MVYSLCKLFSKDKAIKHSCNINLCNFEIPFYFAKHCAPLHISLFIRPFTTYLYPYLILNAHWWKKHVYNRLIILTCLSVVMFVLSLCF